MADLSDVENALVAFIDGVLYPHGDANPSATGDTIRIYAGWPNSAQLDTDLAASVANVSVFPIENLERNTTRYARDDVSFTTPAITTLTATVNRYQIAIGGTVSVPQNVVAICGGRYVFSYAVQAGDTLASIAQGLATLIAARFPGTGAAGPLITVAGSPGIITALVAGMGSVWTEQRRQNKGFDISVWASTPAQRSNIGKLIDLAFAETDWLTLSDKSAARVLYEGTSEIDKEQKVAIYRRCFRFMVEYPTATVTAAPAVASFVLDLQAGPSPDGTVAEATGPTAVVAI